MNAAQEAKIKSWAESAKYLEGQALKKKMEANYHRREDDKACTLRVAAQFDRQADYYRDLIQKEVYGV